MDIEDMAGNKFNPRKITNLLFRQSNVSEEEINTTILFIKKLIEIINNEYSIDNFTKADWIKIITGLKKKYSIAPSVVRMNYYYRHLLDIGEIDVNIIFETFCKAKKNRVDSGICQVTVVTSPHPDGKNFSCESDCYYCPNEPAHEGNNFQAQPRSYVYGGPSTLRANANNFNASLQMWDRLTTLLLLGHDVDKLEVSILGGTWGSYDDSYREKFIRDIYYAANTFYEDIITRRNALSLEEEIDINSTTAAKIIGLTIETRPDHVTYHECLLFRKFNVTRVQIGVQHTDKKVLSKINRGCYVEDTERAIFNLFNMGIKVDTHWMFDLPTSTSEMDIKMITDVFNNSNIRFDQAKFYPFASVPWTKTKEWEDKGIITHYPQQELNEVLVHAISLVPYWVRLVRVIRDIPSNYISGGNDKTNLRQDIDKILEERNIKPNCIRYREVKNKPEAIELMDKAKIFVEKYEASGGTSYFVSYESPNREYIYGYGRLYLSKNAGYIKDIKPRVRRKTKEDNIEKMVNAFPELNGNAQIRELHVYGNMNSVDKKNNYTNTQHKGIGTILMNKMEIIFIKNNYKKISVISGVGARKYYENKHNYKLGKYDYMYKNLRNYDLNNIIIIICIYIIISFFIFCFF